jgi:hypothetical protein
MNRGESLEEDRVIEILDFRIFEVLRMRDQDTPWWNS